MTSQVPYFRYLESAQQAETADQLRRNGFAVEEQKQVGEAVFDLVATKDGQGTVYEFKSAGHTRFSRQEFLALQKAAAQAGYIFRTVVTVPPPRVDIEIDDLAQELFGHLLNNFPSELDSLSTHTRLEGVHNISVSSVRVGDGAIRVSGSANVDVSLQYGSDRETVDESRRSDAFPFTFTARIDTDGHLQQVEQIDVDTSDFYD